VLLIVYTCEILVRADFKYGLIIRLPAY